MELFLILLLGLLAVMAVPGLVFVIADLLGPTETRHISRRRVVDADQPARESTAAGSAS